MLRFIVDISGGFKIRQLSFIITFLFFKSLLSLYSCFISHYFTECSFATRLQENNVNITEKNVHLNGFAAFLLVLVVSPYGFSLLCTLRKCVYM